MENILKADNIVGKNIIELGAGVGFDGIIANALGAQTVLITDGSEEVLKLADENIRINCDSSNGITADYDNEDEQKSHQQRITTARLRWNTDDEEAFVGRSWDYIFASDVTYLQKNRADLIKTIVRLSGPSTTTLISMEPRNVDEVRDVLHEAESQGLVWKEELSPVDPQRDQCGLLCARIFSLRKSQYNSI